MLKAIFLDLDETLCATSEANTIAIKKIIAWLNQTLPSLNAERFCQRYLDGIYRKLKKELSDLPNAESELDFRHQLIAYLLAEQHIKFDAELVHQVQNFFDNTRIEAFDFFPQTEEMLMRLREKYTLVVITNGPLFSQLPKIERVQLREKVDFVIVGGDEPEEKPAQSIFEKALTLANCQPSEAIHVGDSFECDIIGAANSQIPSIWVTNTESYQKQADAKLADYVIFSSSEIESQIQKHAQTLGV